MPSTELSFEWGDRWPQLLPLLVALCGGDPKDPQVALLAEVLNRRDEDLEDYLPGSVRSVHFDMGPGLVSQITSAPYRAVEAETYTSFEATLNTAPSTGDVDVAVKKNGSTQTSITIANAATTEDHSYTLTLADGDVVTMEVTDGNGSGAEGLHIVMVP